MNPLVRSRDGSLKLQIEHTVGRASWPERNSEFWIGFTATRSAQDQPLYDVSQGRARLLLTGGIDLLPDPFDRSIDRACAATKLTCKRTLNVR